jgi:hypothetical protein
MYWETQIAKITTFAGARVVRLSNQNIYETDSKRSPGIALC